MRYRWTVAVLLIGSLACQTGYSGQWNIAPTAQYTCGFGLVQIMVNRLQITDTNPTVTIALAPTFGGGNLTGTFTSPTSVVATRTLPGACTESWRLTLTFTSAGQLTGSFDVTFTGAGGACLDCVRQSWLITGTRQLASYMAFGPGCAGSLGVTQLAGTQLPRLGTTMLVTLNNLPVNAAFQVTGWSNTTSALGPLPVPLAGFGMPGCSGRVSIDATAFVLGSVNTATWSMAIPNLAGLLGGQFHQQALVLDPGRNALGAVTSDAATATVGY